MSELKQQMLAAILVVFEGDFYKVGSQGDEILLKDPGLDPNADRRPLRTLKFSAADLKSYTAKEDCPGVWVNDVGEVLRVVSTVPGEQFFALTVDTMSDEDGLNEPVKATASLSAGLIARIRRLAAAAVDLNCACIEDYDYTPDYYGLREEAPRIDTHRLVVAAQEFWWEGLLKNTTVRIQTSRIPLSELNS